MEKEWTHNFVLFRATFDNFNKRFFTGILPASFVRGVVLDNYDNAHLVCIPCSDNPFLLQFTPNKFPNKTEIEKLEFMLVHISTMALLRQG